MGYICSKSYLLRLSNDMGSQYYRDDTMFTTGDQSASFNQFNPWNLPTNTSLVQSFPSKVVKAPGSVKKRHNVEGKTPAQIINELFKGTSDEYDNDGTMFKCSLTVDGQVFHAISSSKKNAKHEACLLALQSLRPEIAAEVSGCDVNNKSVLGRFGPPPVGTPNVPTKKRKVDSMDCSSSLKELLSKLCLESNKKYKIDSTDVTQSGGDSKLRQLSAVLTFAEEGKMFSHTAEGASVAITMVIRQALKEVFKLSEEDIIKVIKRGQLKKLHNMQSFSALHMMCSSSLYKITVNFEDVVEGKNTSFVCYLTLTSPEGVDIETKGPKCKSKSEAKERAAAVALVQIFQIHPASLDASSFEKDLSITPVSQLFEIGSRQKPALRPEFVDMGEEMNGTLKFFKFKCIVGGREFLGNGKSKRDAKNESANLALNNIFHMNVSMKKEDEGDESTMNDAICAYVRTQYESMANHFSIPCSSDFACFVLLNENNEKKLISIGSSPQSATPLGVVTESGGKSIVHHESVVYARRGAVRFFITQLAKAEKGEDSCLEVVGGGMFRMKESLRLCIVTSNPIDIRFSAPESTMKRLGVYGQCNLLEVVDEKEEPRVHCVADKIFKWCHLGVQGSLLTNRINPIIPCGILTMSRCPLSDLSYVHSFTSRICPPPFPICVHSSKMTIDAAPSPAHIWSRAESKLEKISHYTGLTSEGRESCCSKYQLYKAFLDATPRFPKKMSYYEAKNMAGGYVSSKGLFYHEMVKAGFGKWNGIGGLGDRFVIG